MYTFRHSGQVSLYTPYSENLSWGGLCGVSNFPMMLFVRKAILRPVFEYVCDVGCFFAYVCKGGPFMFEILCGFCLHECVGYGFLIF
jgi:hypothetical protein